MPLIQFFRDAAKSEFLKHVYLTAFSAKECENCQNNVGIGAILFFIVGLNI